MALPRRTLSLAPDTGLVESKKKRISAFQVLIKEENTREPVGPIGMIAKGRGADISDLGRGDEINAMFSEIANLPEGEKTQLFS